MEVNFAEYFFKIQTPISGWRQGNHVGNIIKVTVNKRLLLFITLLNPAFPFYLFLLKVLVWVYASKVVIFRFLWPFSNQLSLVYATILLSQVYLNELCSDWLPRIVPCSNSCPGGNIAYTFILNGWS